MSMATAMLARHKSLRERDERIAELENTVAMLGREVDARDQRLDELSEGIRRCNRYCPAMDALEKQE